MNSRLYNTLLLTFAIAAFGVVGSMDMNDAIAIEAEQTMHCRDKLYLRVALTADEARGRCDQPEGTIK